MDYKKIIKSRKSRLQLLKKFSWLPDGIMLRLQYRIKMGFWPNFKNPRRFTEKVQLFKMFYHNPIMFQCVDKFEVRQYVESKGMGSILNKLYGVFESVDDIDFALLPEKFIAKSTTGGGGLDILIVNDKSKLNCDDVKKKMKSWCWKRKDGCYVDPGREWAYTGVTQSRIIIEELLEDDRNEDGSIEDYKLMCFNGNFGSLWVDKNRYSNHKRGFWDKDLNFLPNVTSDHDTFDVAPTLPDNIYEMISMAEKLSEDFPYARVDFYNIKGRIVFGEITFYPWSGYVKFHPDEFDFHLGGLFNTDFAK